MGVERSGGTGPTGIGQVTVTDDPVVDNAVNEPSHTTPDVVRNSGLAASVTSAERTEVIGPGALRSVEEAVARVTNLLSLGAFDWTVTNREARQAVDTLRNLPPDALPHAVDRIAPDLLSRLEKNIPPRVRQANRETLAAVQAARNRPTGESIDVDALTADLRRSLDGFLALDLVIAEHAVRDRPFPSARLRRPHASARCAGERSHDLKIPVLSLASTVGQHFSALKAVADLMRQRYGVDSQPERTSGDAGRCGSRCAGCCAGG